MLHTTGASSQPVTDQKKATRRTQAQKNGNSKPRQTPSRAKQKRKLDESVNNESVNSAT